MTFRVTAQALRQQVTQSRTLVAIPTEDGCRACEWYQSSVSRCVHPMHGCTSGGHRIDPWRWMRPCPVSSAALK